MAAGSGADSRGGVGWGGVKRRLFCRRSSWPQRPSPPYGPCGPCGPRLDCSGKWNRGRRFRPLCASPFPSTLCSAEGFGALFLWGREGLTFSGWLFVSQYYASAPIVVDRKTSAQPGARRRGWGAVANSLITSLLIVQKRSRLASFLLGPCPGASCWL